MISQSDNSVMFDNGGNAVPVNRVRRRLTGQAKAMLSGFKGANDEQLADWVFLPLEINQILRNDLQKLRARTRDLARNDDTVRRFLSLLKQNVLGHRGIGLQAKNKQRNGKLDKRWNAEIEREWKSWSRKRRRRGVSTSPSACGEMSLRQLQWLILQMRAIDGECFVQILRGYPHNKHRFAIRLLSPDLLDHAFEKKDLENGNRIEMGIEFDEFDRRVAYHFSKEHPHKRGSNKEKVRIPADQIIHVYRKEFTGQLRGIPDFVAVMHKGKMLNGVNEAVVVGWRVAACKMGFFVSKDSEDFPDPEADPDGNGEERSAPENTFDANPGQIDYIDDAKEFREFNPDYPTSTYAEGYKTFMRQMANGLNVSSPTLMNDYSDVNYSSLRQALLEDREGWRCIQADLEDDIEQPLFDEWYDWTTNVTELIRVSESKRRLDPEVKHTFRGWPWVDPLKEVKAQVEAVNNKFRTRQSVMSDTDGSDFTETVDALQEENAALEERGLAGATAVQDDVLDDESKANDE